MKFIRSSRHSYFEFAVRDQIIKVPIEFKGRHKIGGKQDLLVRALGKKVQGLKVLDLTAGLGRDAFHMAQLGCEVTALERNLQLAEALQAAWISEEHSEKLMFVRSEAIEYMQDFKESKPDVIFYDPMFPEKKKAALAGKESQLLQLLATPDTAETEGEILTLALKVATQRVVVKRPLPAAPILRKPDVVFKGKSIRYDVYLS